MRRCFGPGEVRARVFALAGVLWTMSAGCGDDGSDGAKPRDASVEDARMRDASASKTVSYQRDVKPIFLAYCTTCHYSGSVIDVDLMNPFDPEHGVVDRANSWAIQHESKFAVHVKPGAPDESFLIYKVSADPNPETFDVENNGSPMPLQLPRATSEELANVEQWIMGGAKNDAFFTEKVAPVFGTEITQGRRSGKCTFCHYPNSPTGLNVLDVFNATTGMVDVDSALSTKKRVAPGSPEDSFLIDKLKSDMPKGGAQMPLHYPRLTRAQIDTLRSWIELGANDD